MTFEFGIQEVANRKLYQCHTEKNQSRILPAIELDNGKNYWWENG